MKTEIISRQTLGVMAQGVKIWVWEQRGVVSSDSNTEKEKENIENLHC